MFDIILLKNEKLFVYQHKRNVYVNKQIGGTLGSSSRHTGWEPLLYAIENQNHQLKSSYLNPISESVACKVFPVNTACVVAKKINSKLMSQQNF